MSWSGGVGGETVGSRQVDQLGGSAPAQGEGAAHVLDGHSGVVADVLREPCEGVEKSGLAGVGVADQGDRRRRLAPG